MTPSFRVALPVLAIALLPQLAHAGPIGWNYTATFATDAGADLLYLGRHIRPDSAEPDGFLEGTIYGVPTAVSAAGSYPGSARFRVGQLSDVGVGVYWDSEAPPPPIDPRFVLGLTIRDAASGETGAFTAVGTGTIVSDPMLYDFALSLSLAGGTDQEQVIGDTRYRVRLSTESDGDGAYVVADVSTGPAVATPEPGTLALAGFGLAAVGLLRARRRTAPLASSR
jgi:hypothetical protein